MTLRRLIRHHIAGTIAVMAALFTTALPSGAQRMSASMDLGTTRVRYEDGGAMSAYALSPWIALAWARTTVSASATASQFTGNMWSADGGVTLATRTSSFRKMSLGGALFAGGSTHQSGLKTAEGRAFVAAQIDARNFGGAIGSGFGQTWDGFENRTLVFGQGSVWAQYGRHFVQASITPNALQDGPRFTDFELDANTTGRRLELGGSIGVRGGHDSVYGSRTRLWGGINATLWATPIVGLVMSAGTYPASLAQALPGGRYLTAAIRLSTRPQKKEPGEAPNALPPEGTAPQLVITQSGPGLFLVRVFAAQAQSVELISDLTQWRTSSFKRSRTAGWWEMSLRGGAGVHQLNIRVNGGSWIVPGGVSTMRDEFGGTIGWFELP